jgi:beta-galactosidase/beta-glucuronidase
MRYVLPASLLVAFWPAAGQQPVWDAAKALHESTLTRERISVNGLWRWQPAAADARDVPSAGWGFLRVPESWPSRADGPQVFSPNPAWNLQTLGAATAAWYQREITIPRDWPGRRITLYAEYLNSYAAVYIDGVQAGEMRYPAGEVDITAACRPGSKHLLSMHVVAMPLKAVLLSFNDTASAREVAGKVDRKGLCGDVYLSSSPAGARISDVKIDTSVRRWQITFDTAVEALDPNAKYMLRAQIHDGAKQVEEFASRPFTQEDLAHGRLLFTESWRPAKLWDTHTPQNQYRASVTLLTPAHKQLDTALPVRFGFREFWIDGRDFYLNGTRIYLSAIPLDNGQLSSLQASYEATRATLQRFKSFGINFVYTHNYGCEPGAHYSFAEVLRAADDEGMLLSFSQPHFGHYDWVAPDADRSNGYARHAEFYVRVAQNHPATVAYSTSHNSTGYGEDMNPDMIDGIQAPREQWALRNASRALRAEAIIRHIDSSRVVYHHASGNLGSLHAINFYGNWIPIQEMSDWFEHWATTGVKPVFTCEYSVPFLWDWGMYRGWYKGKREFGSAAVPWDFEVAEWNAQFLGDSAYQIGEEEKRNIRWEAGKFHKSEVWHRWDYPQSLNSQVFDERFRVIAAYLTDNFRAFRTWGVSARSPWEYESYWRKPNFDKPRDRLDLAVDWDNLQRPGSRPVYRDEDEARARLAYHPADYQPTAAAEALVRNNMPLLAYIAGKRAAFTSKDHNFLPGETVEKQIIVINETRVAVAAACEWSFRSAKAAASVTVQPGDQQRVPLRFDLPADLAPGRYELQSSVKFPTGQTQADSFAIDVMPPPEASAVRDKIALFDPKGETATLLQAMGVTFERVDAQADLAAFSTLIVGKGALTLQNAAPDLTRVREGLKTIVFEQTADVLEKRLGFRIAEYGLRQVFKRVPDHPLLAGVDERNLHDWRGSATTSAPRLAYKIAPQFNYVPTVEWAGIPVTRVWRNGSRGSVASVLIETPAQGDFLPILDGGYALQYSPLLVHREGRGMVLFCQMDITGRTESDPAAQTLARNILQYATNWKSSPARTVVYDAAHLTSDQVLVVRPGHGRGLAPHAARIADWLRSGGHVLAIGLEAREANSFLPVQIATESREHIAAYFPPFAAGSPFAGISPGEVHNRGPRQLPLVTGGATIAGNGVLASSADGSIVFSQIDPAQFQNWGEQINLKRTFRRVSCLTARLLANLGAAPNTPLLAQFAKPVKDGDKRWLDGLYLDVPEEWDDPYRFFRW